ncbi:hypothetical protein FRC05_006087 [Tulasnella sp. 425]|nr:hypothetical protein FRC05_006087 [Tulasnella sp. 425]
MSQCLSAVKALKPPTSYVVPELNVNEDRLKSFERSRDEEADIPSHRELDGRLAPPSASPPPAVTPSLGVRYQDPGSLRLNEYLEEHPSANRFDIVKQIANGLECLHSNNIVHGDLRMNTFVVSVSGVVQVAGFGLVELLGVAPEDLFTIRVSSLEVLQGAPPTTASDVYAFANVALEVFTGSQPWVKLARDATVLGALHRGSHSKAESYPDFPNKAVLWDLFKLCWDPDPAKRPVMGQVNKTLLRIAKGLSGLCR